MKVYTLEKLDNQETKDGVGEASYWENDEFPAKFPNSNIIYIYFFGLAVHHVGS